ncbi:hypothetical protein SteCoe_10822 [Stentor coeruleus]|uniref:Palmitoyltransferase n=1 Tax=Stentor coeruleus TaxID=5963 RepID=A0A1R2CEN2_9CILI|nr:hypothetical protein SteCoe_10822 [Stentor coeruleus]
MKKNGFQRPFHKLQIVSWVYMLFMIGIYGFLVLPLFPYQIKVIVSMFFTCNLIMIIVLGFICTLIDPTDPAVKEAKRAEILSKSMDLKKYPKICKVCKFHVNMDTKHCRDCDRCVLHFDHHCKWLNNCIGVKNYKIYVHLLVFFELFNILIVITGAFILSGIIEKNSFYDRLNEKLKMTSIAKGTYMALLVIMDILALIVSIANSQLLIFHGFLAYKKKTTYEYILEQRKKESKYKISTVKIINEREAIEEVPLEEIFEPYIENPQYNYKNQIENNPDRSQNYNPRVQPENISPPSNENAPCCDNQDPVDASSKIV